MLTIITAIIAGLTAFLLTRWMRRIAKATTESVWLTHYLHVPLATALGAGAALLADNAAELVGYTLLGIGCALLTMIDLAAMRLPNIIIGPLYLLLVTTLAAAAFLNEDPMRLLQALGCAAAMMGLYLALALIRRGQLGFGDVKFGGVLGLFLGWLGWGEALLGMLAAFILSALAGLGLMWFFKMTRKQMLPFGPFMVVGAAVGAAVGSSFLAI